MIWRSSYTSLMALWNWLCILLMLTALFTGADKTPFPQDRAMDMFFWGCMGILANVGFRVLAFFVDLIFAAFGTPLFYDLKIEER